MPSPSLIDLHIHSTVSDGTDTPEQLLQKVRRVGIRLFSLTDHDAVKGCSRIRALLTDSDPLFLNGIEFSCRDDGGEYHILGYHYHSTNAVLQDTVALGHQYRINKLIGRLQFLETHFGFVFSEEEKKQLLTLNNPGKPHIARLMVQHRFAASKEEAIRTFLNAFQPTHQHIHPRQAIEAILAADGIPVLAHPVYGSGDQLIIGEALAHRLRYLMAFGLQGVEAFYSGFTPSLTNELLSLAGRYDLYVTAGSDYHGANKLISIGEVPLPAADDYPPGLKRFLQRTADTQGRE